jgi:hypothetical protein
MLRKLIVVAAAIAMPISLVAVGSTAASASSPRVLTNTDTIVCKDITGTVSFSPKEDAKGYTNEAVKATVNATVSDCTESGPTTIAVDKGVVTGTLTGSKGTKSSPAGTCAGLLAKSSTETGTLTISWDSFPSGIDPSDLTIASIGGGKTAKGYGFFTIPGAVKGSAIGSFRGNNKGASDKSTSQTKDTASALAKSCESSGLSSVAITKESGVNALSLS